ncbi:MAG: putative hydrolase [Alphaproteobacteria bacterium]|nr:putative hydrolase [Alphaproteobacteria bacterium]
MDPRSLLLAGLAFLLAAAAPFEPVHIGTRIVYRHAALIDGTGAPLRADMAVVTDGERIVSVLPDRALRPAQLAGAEQVDLSGRYLLPGLIDSHQHLATPPDRPAAEASLRRDVYSGVTAIRDMADDLRQVGDLARAARVGEIPSPDIYYAALMAGPSFFADARTQAAAEGADAGHVPWMQAIDERTDLPLAVAMARGTSASAIKIYANLPGALVAAIAKEAHRQGIPVWAHGMVFPATPEEVIGAGVDTVSHTCYLAYQPMARRPDSYQHRFPVDFSLFENDNPVMASLFAEMQRRGTILDATLRVYESVEASARQAGKPPQCTLALAAKLTNQAWRAGVSISTGTDGEAPRDYPWPAVFDEFELLAGPAGMPPAAVIRAATLTGAAAIGRQKEMGSVEPGKLANLAVLARNPLEDVHNLRSVVLTVKRGRRFARVDYTPEPAHVR